MPVVQHHNANDRRRTAQRLWVGAAVSIAVWAGWLAAGASAAEPRDVPKRPIEVSPTERAPETAAGRSQPTYRTFFVTRSLDHERLMPYLETARPEIVQIGNYGAMFHGHADHPKSTGTPMMLPVVGERKALEFQRQLNDKVHALGLTVVGHFRLVKVLARYTNFMHRHRGLYDGGVPWADARTRFVTPFGRTSARNEA